MQVVIDVHNLVSVQHVTVVIAGSNDFGGQLHPTHYINDASTPLYGYLHNCTSVDLSPCDEAWYWLKYAW